MLDNESIKGVGLVGYIYIYTTWPSVLILSHIPCCHKSNKQSAVSLLAVKFDNFRKYLYMLHRQSNPLT